MDKPKPRKDRPSPAPKAKKVAPVIQPSVEVLPKAEIERVVVGELARKIRVLERNLPLLSDADIQRIADRVAAELVETWLDKSPQNEKNVWRERLKKVAYEIAIALVGSGIWAALSYAMTQVFWMAGREMTPEQRQFRQRMLSVREKLAAGMSRDDIKDLDSDVAKLQRRLASDEELTGKVAEFETFKAFVSTVEAEHARLGRTFTGNFEEWCSRDFFVSLIQLLAGLTHERLAPLRNS